MENASKALIIAGAILLSILIIAIGMYIYNSSQNSIATAGSQISAQEIQSFNTQWEMYEGLQTGTNVKSLISKLAANAKINEAEQSRLLNLYYEASATNQNGNGDSFVSSVGNADTLNISKFNTARTQIESRHTYKVTLLMSESTSLVKGVLITYDPSYNPSSLSIYSSWTQ